MLELGTRPETEPFRIHGNLRCKSAISVCRYPSLLRSLRITCGFFASSTGSVTSYAAASHSFYPVSQQSSRVITSNYRETSVNGM